MLQAIVADYDLTDPNALDTVHNTLSALEAAAIADAESAERHTSDDLKRSSQDLPPEVTSLNPHNDSTNRPPDNDGEDLPDITDNDTKLAILQEIFPEFSSYDISYTLSKCDGHWKKALDILLNHQFLAADSDHHGSRPLSMCRGADGFFEDHASNQYRRKKSRAKAKNPALMRQRSNSAPETENVDPSTWGHAARRSQATATLTPQYAALSLHHDDDDDTSLSSTFAAVAGTDPSQYRQLADTHSTAYQAALEQARAAYRRSRSSRLMGGAAAYYSQLGRDHAQNSRAYSSAAADALVSANSTAGSIDLHGVNVQDAVRISLARVRQWWGGLGEDKVNGRIGAGSRAQGFTIITGVGRHSEGGRGKLGPAVKQALTSDGWRIEMNTGSITVKGKARRGV